MTTMRRQKDAEDQEEPAAAETGFLSGLTKAVRSLRPKGGFFSRAAAHIESATEDNADESPKSKGIKSPKGKSPLQPVTSTLPVDDLYVPTPDLTPPAYSPS